MAVGGEGVARLTRLPLQVSQRVEHRCVVALLRLLRLRQVQLDRM